MKFKSSIIVIVIFVIQHSVAGSIGYDVINQLEEHYDVTKKDVPVADNNTVCSHFVINKKFEINLLKI